MDTNSLPRNQLWRLFGRTLGYSLLLAAVLEGGQEVLNAGITLITSPISGGGLVMSPVDTASNFLFKAIWAVLVCELVVFLSVTGRKRWLLLSILGLLGTLLSVFMAQAVRANVMQWLANRPPFDLGGAVQVAWDRAAKYAGVGPLLAWVNQLPSPGIGSHALAGIGAGALAAVGAAIFARPQSLGALGGELFIDVLFPLGCNLVVWRMRSVGAHWIAAHEEAQLSLHSRAMPQGAG
jgi:hypothetical protein